MISSFFGCWLRFICLIATSIPVELSIAVYTVPDAPWPIFSILLYFRFGSPTLTIVRSFSRISSSDIFFFFKLAARCCVAVVVVVVVLRLLVPLLPTDGGGATIDVPVGSPSIPLLTVGAAVPAPAPAAAATTTLIPLLAVVGGIAWPLPWCCCCW
uniref:Putative secreted peptide n=1 Tax=Anopheles braziliensis TaxID=58242 RepID=A0A2M3ZSI9_9DIPT